LRKDIQASSPAWREEGRSRKPIHPARLGKGRFLQQEHPARPTASPSPGAAMRQRRGSSCQRPMRTHQLPSHGAKHGPGARQSFSGRLARVQQGTAALGPQDGSSADAGIAPTRLPRSTRGLQRPPKTRRRTRAAPG